MKKTDWIPNHLVLYEPSWVTVFIWFGSGLHQNLCNACIYPKVFTYYKIQEFSFKFSRSSAGQDASEILCLKFVKTKDLFLDIKSMAQFCTHCLKIKLRLMSPSFLKAWPSEPYEIIHITDSLAETLRIGRIKCNVAVRISTETLDGLEQIMKNKVHLWRFWILYSNL